MCSPLNIHTWSKVNAKMLLVGGRSWTAHVSPCGNCAASPSSEQPIERRLETLFLVSPLRGDVGLRSTLNQTRTLPSVWRVSRSAPSRTPTRGLNLSRVLAQRRVQSRERKRDACTENLRTSQDAQTIYSVEYTYQNLDDTAPGHHPPWSRHNEHVQLFTNHPAVTRGSVRKSEHRKTQSPKTRPRCGNFQSLWMTAFFCRGRTPERCERLNCCGMARMVGDVALWDGLRQLVCDGGLYTLVSPCVL